MSDIICARCGEPWDSTGGIHSTHSDLVDEDYKRLVEGSGCPCCHENLIDTDEYTVQHVAAWQRSVEHLSEGRPEYMYVVFDTQPKRVPLNQIYNPER